MPIKTAVAIVRTSDHETLDRAVAAALTMIQADTIIDPDDAILIKPNLLMKMKNACTAPDFLQGVTRFVAQKNRHMHLGDSPGQFRHRAKSVIQSIGMDAVMAAEGIEYAEFESGGVLVTNEAAAHMRTFHMAKPVMDADCIINLCRPKSHIEAVYTGAVKNFWGIIPGGEKARCHLYGRNPEAFGEVLVDNYQTLRSLGKKRIVVMDARRFMEGPGGPASGHMRKVGLILAGTDEVAVDLVMLAIARFNGFKTVPHLRACRNRGLGPADLDGIDIRGAAIEDVRLNRRILLPSRMTANVLNNYIFRTLIYKFIRQMPVLKNRDACIMCGDCHNICPNNAIAWQKRQLPVFDATQCISCLCCVECCPQQALAARGAGVRGLFLKFPEINLPETAEPS
ncbi:MAG: DUF362 domain-containing protein [Thermodesulfobacteriota bacterium]|nr:DUF362 domain-containing protein [Thermodesulfobacteriota bacterium]